MMAKILLVDDDPVLLTLLESTLGKENHALFSASSATQGLRIVEVQQPDLIISDYYMPGMDGFEFCRKVKEHPLHFGTMFMLLTSASETESKVEGLETGADDYLTKPFAPLELRSKVHALLRIKSLQDELARGKEALEKAHSALGDRFSGVLTLLGHIIGLRVPNASVRAERAAHLCTWMSRKLQLDEEEIKPIEVAARIHEIGKIVLPDALLQKQWAEMGQEDRATMGQFPLHGHRMVEKIPGFEAVATMLRQQMENFDGTGFPDKLMGEEISLGGRLLRIANFMDEKDPDGTVAIESITDALQEAKGTLLSPRFAQLAAEYILVEESSGWLEGKRQVRVEDLTEGMVIALDLYTGSGTKLLARDTRLSASHVARIRAIHLADPILSEIFVFV